MLYAFCHPLDCNDKAISDERFMFRAFDLLWLTWRPEMASNLITKLVKLGEDAKYEKGNLQTCKVWIHNLLLTCYFQA